jgi:N-acyl homoserine lactone hydrolase
MGNPMLLTRRLSIAFAFFVGLAVSSIGIAQNRPDSIRLYVLDGGSLEASPSSYNLLDEEVQTTLLSLASFLIVHPDGVFLWDAGAVPDSERVMEGIGARQIVIRSDKRERPVTLGPSLLGQLAEIGYTPADITHFSMSHFHWDHSANANLFAHANWLVRPEEREAMYEVVPGGNSGRPMTYSDLRDGNTITLVTTDEHDVFGDGTVILKAAPGHTAGHQVIYVELVETGGVVLSGDLYHYPEERTLNRLPVSDFNLEQTRASRTSVDEFLVRKEASLWIQHDQVAHLNLKKAPEYYD